MNLKKIKVWEMCPSFQITDRNFLHSVLTHEEGFSN